MDHQLSCASGQGNQTRLTLVPVALLEPTQPGDPLSHRGLGQTWNNAAVCLSLRSDLEEEEEEEE